MDNIIDFKPRTEAPINVKRREAIKKLAHYRGEVQSKNTIRQLPDVKVGEIFWVEMDNKAYIVADRDKKKMTIKALDENASISTGVTIFEMNKSIVSKEPIFNWSDEMSVREVTDRMCDWFNKDNSDVYYLLYGRDIHYVTLFKVVDLASHDSVKIIKEALDAVGDIISIDFNTTEGEKCVEIWIRTETSAAELLYLFPYDRGLIEL